MHTNSYVLSLPPSVQSLHTVNINRAVSRMCGPKSGAPMAASLFAAPIAPSLDCMYFFKQCIDTEATELMHWLCLSVSIQKRA